MMKRLSNILIITFCLFFSVNSLNQLKAQVSPAEYAALEALYNATNGPEWTDNALWDFSGTADDVTSDWAGLTVTTGQVRQIHLYNNGLSGTIPDEIGDFIHARSIRLHQNSLVGEIPATIQNLINLETLDLDRNNLEGNVPEGLGDLVNLHTLQLFTNNFTGDLPEGVSNFANLSTFRIDGNEFDNIPDLSGLGNLSIVRIQNNKLHFNSIEPLMGIGIPQFEYLPQKKVGQVRNIGRLCGAELELHIEVRGEYNIYQWYHNDVEIVGADSDTYYIESFLPTHAGTYHLEINNSLVTNLTLVSEDINVVYMGAIPPEVETNATPLDITINSAELGGEVTLDGCATISARGIRFSAVPGVVANGVNHPHATGGLGEFSVVISDLNPNTIYYYAAYATNSAGTSYGEEYEFTTDASLPTVTTATATDVEEYSARMGGEVTSGGGLDVISRGIYYGIDENPEDYAAPVPMGDGLGTFSDIISGLEPGTTYYFKAYAENIQGEAYGIQRSFKTIAILPEVETVEAEEITHESARVGGEILYTGGTEINVTARGVYWGEDLDPGSPATTGTRLQIGSGPGQFSSAISGLSPATLYYFMAFATNEIGTTYGDMLDFTTEPYIPVVATFDAIDISAVSATIRGEVISDEGCEIMERGFYFGTTRDFIEDGEVIEVDGELGVFSFGLEDLRSNKIYYFMAFAINSAGMGEGEILSFKTEIADQVAFIPNAFNPNSSVEINRTFKPIFEFIPSDYKMDIFNRWGNKVFSTSEYTEGWNGVAAGKEAPIGPYQYRIKYVDERGEQQVKIGVLNLVR